MTTKLKRLFEEKKMAENILQKTIKKYEDEVEALENKIFEPLRIQLEKYGYLLVAQSHYDKLYFSVFQNTDDKEVDNKTHFSIINYKIVYKNSFIPKNIYDIVESFLKGINND